MSEAASDAVSRNNEEIEKRIDCNETRNEIPLEEGEPASSSREEQNDDDNASESDWKPQRSGKIDRNLSLWDIYWNFSGAFHALVKMLRDGGDPYQLARMIGLDFSRDENPMRVIQHLLAAFAEEKRERQRKLTLDDIVELIKST